MDVIICASKSKKSQYVYNPAFQASYPFEKGTDNMLEIVKQVAKIGIMNYISLDLSFFLRWQVRFGFMFFVCNVIVSIPYHKLLQL